ncbi:hypothetical protein RKE29_18740 [Streptomyces sp. B1866]|uniref:hypothetical protein n=1 Tax=Streptomyces sp. B1866 TaxID=3075431 RepID=UPI00288C9AE5|nr:hypothetical protein [Streptomyces sp. B1866]MDT3398658.1 hypothetical protein [Streptomyces sp. B1866]
MKQGTIKTLGIAVLAAAAVGMGAGSASATSHSNDPAEGINGFASLLSDGLAPHKARGINNEIHEAMGKDRAEKRQRVGDLEAGQTAQQRRQHREEKAAPAENTKPNNKGNAGLLGALPLKGLTGGLLGG